jgi:hypothetical protein
MSIWQKVVNLGDLVLGTILAYMVLGPLLWVFDFWDLRFRRYNLDRD